MEKEMATHFSILALKIPWTKELMSYSSWGCKVSDMTEANEHTCTHQCNLFNSIVI